MKYKYIVYETLEDEDGWLTQEFVNENEVDEKELMLVFRQYPIQDGYEINFYDYVREVVEDE